MNPQFFLSLWKTHTEFTAILTGRFLIFYCGNLLQGCCNRLQGHQQITMSGRFKTTEMYSFMVLEATSLKSRCQQTGALSEASGEGDRCRPWSSLAGSCITRPLWESLSGTCPRQFQSLDLAPPHPI